MENIYEPNGSFDFANISLAHPIGITGGSYFTKIQMNSKPLYIETPKCLTKQGFVKSGKKIYSELMFDNNDEQFIHWMENLEIKCQQLIYEKGESWFQNQLEMNDIETAFTSPMRIYKSGKFYLIRVNVKMNYITNTPQLKIYNENETPLSIDDVTADTNIISILEIQGIKFTSRNFQIELELKQIMVINTNEIFENCLIKTNTHIPAKMNKIAVDNSTFMSQKLDFKILPVVPKLEENIVNNVVNDNVVNDNVVNDNVVNDNVDNLKNMSLLEKISESIINDMGKGEDYGNNEILRNNQSIPEYLERSEALSASKGTDERLNSRDDSRKSLEEQNDVEEQHPTTIASEKIQSSPSANTSGVQSLFATLTPDTYDYESLQTVVDIDSLLDTQNDLKEIIINPNLDSLETITLKKPNQVYYEIYKEARKKAKIAKKTAIVAFLEAKNIKKTYMLDDLDESDSDSDSYNDSDNSDNGSDASDNDSDVEIMNSNN